MIYWTAISGSYFLKGSILEKCGKFWKNGRFFRADMAGLGEYHTGGYGRIGVYRVIIINPVFHSNNPVFHEKQCYCPSLPKM